MITFLVGVLVGTFVGITMVALVSINRFEEAIRDAPTVDAVPVIRCKDCKFSMSGIDKYNERYILCQLHERSYGVIDDGFCMWAERKEE